MMRLKRKERESGQGMVEYALILVLVAVAVIIIIAVFGRALERTYNCLVSTIQGADGGATFTGFTLVDAGSNTDIMPICSAPVSPNTNINIRADTTRTHGSVHFEIVGPTNQSWTENIPPYLAWGDNSGNYNPGSLSPGEYTITATAYSGASQSGTVVGTLSMKFIMQ
jgi:Flp pilus assembly pilin Flp